MKHLYALLIKYAMGAVLLIMILIARTNLTFSYIIIVSIAVTVVSYIIGDLLILPIANNVIATTADALLGAVTIYMFNYVWFNTGISFEDAAIAALALAVGEWFFHKYAYRNVLPDI